MDIAVGGAKRVSSRPCMENKDVQYSCTHIKTLDPDGKESA